MHTRGLLESVSAALVFAAVWLGRPAPATACTCEIDPLTGELWFPSADVIFEGTVTGAAEATTIDLGNGRSWPMSRYPMRAKRYFKGRLGREIDVFTDAPSSSCGFTLERRTYLVYANWGSEDTLQIDLCSETTPISAAAEALASLGEGVAPDRSLDVRAASDEGCSVSVPGANAAAGASCLGAALLLGLAALRCCSGWRRCAAARAGGAAPGALTAGDTA